MNAVVSTLLDQRRLRSQALSADVTAALALGLPKRSDENWRYADLRDLDAIPMLGPEASSAPRSGSLDAKATAGPRIVVDDGVWNRSESTLGDDSKISVSLVEPTQSLSPSGRPIDPGPDDRFAAVNRAFASQQLLIAVAPEADVDLEVVLRSNRPATDGAVHPSLKLHVGSGSRLRWVERLSSASIGPSLMNALVEIELAPGAHCQHHRMQQVDAAARLFETLWITQQADSSYDYCGIETGAAAARLTARVALQGRAARLRWATAVWASQRQVNDSFVKVEHGAAETSTDQCFRGIASAGARAAFNGHLLAASAARGSELRQSLRGLLVDETAEIDLRPQLEILVDDIRAAHGATVGTLDAAMQFYLRSRGLDPNTAAALLKWAFLEDVLRRAASPALRRDAEREMLRRMPELEVLGLIAQADPT